MLGPREGPGLHVVGVRAGRVEEDAVHVGVLLHELRHPAGAQAEGVLPDQHLPVAAGAGADADRGDADGSGHLGRDVAGEVTRKLRIPTIGIGAGNETDGQVLVWQDAFGLRTGRMAKFVKQYADVHGVLLDAARAYADDVRAGTFPGPEHTF